MDKSSATWIRLRLAGALDEDVGTNRVRLDAGVIQALGVEEGEVVELRAEGSAWARVRRAAPSDEGLELARMDLDRQSAIGGSPGDWASVRAAGPRAALHVELAASSHPKELALDAEEATRSLRDRIVVVGDVIEMDTVHDERAGEADLSLAGLRLVSIRTTTGKIAQQTLRVVHTDPSGPVRVGEGTEVVIEPEHQRTDHVADTRE